MRCLTLLFRRKFDSQIFRTQLYPIVPSQDDTSRKWQRYKKDENQFHILIQVSCERNVYSFYISTVCYTTILSTQNTRKCNVYIHIKSNFTQRRCHTALYIQKYHCLYQPSSVSTVSKIVNYISLTRYITFLVKWHYLYA